MYLSRVEIDTKNRRKIKDLIHLGAYHNWVEQSFPDEIKKSERNRHLWRIDRLNGHDYLLIFSEQKPNEHSLERYGVENTAEIKDYNPFLNKLMDGQILRFRLTANPTHRHDGKVLPHVTIEYQKKWLLDKAKQSGFDLNEEQFDIVNREYSPLYKKENRHVNLSKVSFEGILKITDLNKFKQSLVSGIGREKAFGMGLLTVIPVKQDGKQKHWC